MKASCAVVLPIRLFGGHEKMLLEWLGRARAQHGLGVQIYCADNHRLLHACAAAGLGRPVVSHPLRGSSVRDCFITWRLLGRIPRQLPVLFAPGTLQEAALQWLAAFVRRRQVAGYVPMAYSARRMRYRGGSVRDWLVGLVIRRVDVWITISEHQRDLLIDHWQVKRPVFVVPNRLALLEQDAPHSRTCAEAPLRVLFAGRFDANQKGLDWLCDRLRARRSEWMGQLRFTFQGQGDFQAELMRLSRDLGPRHVEVFPWGDAGAAMRKADVLLLPSRFEGVPLVVLEATHYGLPVVASRSAGVMEFVPPACLFDFGDDQAMLAALKALLDPDRRAAALLHARQRVQQSLSSASFRQEVDRIVAALARMGSAVEAT